MRDLNVLNTHRVSSMLTHGWDGDATCGAFEFMSPMDGQKLRVIASSEDGWDHVSVSRTSRVPNWHEMEFIKRKFFKHDECAMQLHVPIGDHLNAHPYCLHIWRPKNVEIPRPPGWMVALTPKDKAK